MTERRKSSSHAITTAFEPDNTLLEILGGPGINLSAVFTSERINAGQKVINAAKDAFFTEALKDMNAIQSLVNNRDMLMDYATLSKQFLPPLCSLKSQADFFGFSLIASICKHLIDYCDNHASHPALSAKDISIILKLTEALERSFKDKISGTGGDMQKELAAIIATIKD